MAAGNIDSGGESRGERQRACSRVDSYAFEHASGRVALEPFGSEKETDQRIAVAPQLDGIAVGVLLGLANVGKFADGADGSAGILGKCRNGGDDSKKIREPPAQTTLHIGKPSLYNRLRHGNFRTCRGVS